jgi:predicted RNA-binding protein YlxR (DUF448 family)
VGCHTVLPKRSLIRLVRLPEGVHIDPTGKMAGRGAYLHDRRACWEKSLKGSLAHALRADLTPEDLGRLRQYMQGLSDDEGAGEQA